MSSGFARKHAAISRCVDSSIVARRGRNGRRTACELLEGRLLLSALPQLNLATSSDAASVAIEDLPSGPVGTERVATLGGAVIGVCVSGNYAYEVTGSGLQIIDISDPAEPVRLGTYRAYPAARDVTVAGSYAYVADFFGGLQIIDVSNPAAPTLSGALTTDGTGYGVAVAGSYAYLADGEGGLRIIDVSHPAVPTLVGKYDLTDSAHMAYGVTIAGTYAYVAAGTLGLQIIDISNPARPTLMGTYDTTGVAQNVTVAGSHAYFTSGGSLQIIDINNPVSPTLAGSYTPPQYWEPRSVTVAGVHAYVADRYQGLWIIDTTDAAKPALAGRYEGSHAVDVAVAGSHAFIANQFTGLHVIRCFASVNPTDIVVSSTSIPENEAAALVGTFSTEDADVSSVFKYTLPTYANADSYAFTITGNGLRTWKGFNYEAKPSYSILVQAMNQYGLSVEKTFTITVTDVNESPTAITLSNSTIAENATSVGFFSASDPDVGNTFTYSLIPGTGSDDNVAFDIVGDELRATLDYEAKSSYSIRVKAMDQGGLAIEKAFTITVTDVTEAPTAITLSNSTIAEGAAYVGTLSAIDPDAESTFTYSLITGTGSDDNGAFEIVGDEVRAAGTLDYETKSSYSIRVRAMDQDGLSTEKSLTITLTNVNESPTSMTLSNSTIAEGATATIGTLSAIDPDAGNTFTYWLLWSPDVADDGAFQIVGNELRTSGSLDYETKASYSIRLRVTDQDDYYYERTVVINVSNVAESPVSLSGSEAADDISVSVSGSKLEFRLNGKVAIAKEIALISGVTIRGGGGNDKISVGSLVTLPVLIYGDGGKDTITGGSGNDSLYGGNGADSLTPGLGADLISGGAGRDLVSYSERAAAIHVTLDGQANDGESGEADNLHTDLEVIYTGSGDDEIHAAGGSVEIRSGAGNDLVYAGDGNDIIWGDDGDDTLYGAAGADYLRGGPGDDVIYAGWDADVVNGDDGKDSIYGGLGADSVLGGPGNDKILGGDGSDTLRGGNGNDYIEGKGKADLINGDGNDDTLFGQAGNDTIYGGTGNDVIHVYDGLASVFSDKVFGGYGTDSVSYDALDTVVEADLLS